MKAACRESIIFSALIYESYITVTDSLLIRNYLIRFADFKRGFISLIVKANCKQSRPNHSGTPMMKRKHCGRDCKSRPAREAETLRTGLQIPSGPRTPMMKRKHCGRDCKSRPAQDEAETLRTGLQIPSGPSPARANPVRPDGFHFSLSTFYFDESGISNDSKSEGNSSKYFLYILIPSCSRSCFSTASI